MTASPTPPSSPPSVPSVPVPGRRGSSGWMVPVVAAVVGVVAGAGIGWLLWSGPDSAASGTGVDDAAADAAGACQAWQRVPEFGALHSGGKEDTAWIHFNRALSAAYLARTAAELDDGYQDLSEALQEIEMRLKTFDIKGTEAKAAHEKVSSLCAGLDG